MRRRRRQRLQWFPTLGSAVDTESTARISGFTWSVTVHKNNTGGTSGFETIAIPLIPDISQAALERAQDDGDEVSLADTQERSYRIRRLVGRLWAAKNQLNGETTAGCTACLLGAGLAVLRVGTDDAPAMDDAEYNVLSRTNITEPWFWRRVWLLGSDGFNGELDPTLDAFAQFPRGNVWDTGLGSTSFVDAKTNRVIGPDERLHLVLTTRRLPLDPAIVSPNDDVVAGYFDYRVLGSIFRSTNRRNASM